MAEILEMLDICRCDKQAQEREHIFCGYCGQPVYIPWKAEKTPLDGLQCLAAHNESGSYFVRFSLDTTSMMGKNIAQGIKTIPARLGKYLNAKYRGVAGKTIWNAQTSVLAVRWPEEQAPPPDAAFDLDVAILLQPELSKAYNGESTEVAFRYRAQPLNYLKITSGDPRFSQSAEGARLLNIAAPKSLAAAFSFDIHYAGGSPFTDAFLTIVLTASGITERLTPDLRDGALHCILGAEQWERLFGGCAKDTTSPLIFSLKNQADELMASTALTVEHIELSLAIPQPETLRFVFDEDASWVKHGVPRVIGITQSGEWSSFSVALIPDEQLAAIASVELEISGSQMEVRAKLNLRCASDSQNVPQLGSYLLKVVPCAKSNRRAINPELELATIEIQIIAEARELIEVLAVDFGTSNTAAAMCRNRGGRIETVTIDDRRDTPTTMYYWSLDGNAIDYGQSAIGDSANSLFEDKPSHSRYFRGLKTELIGSVTGGPSEPHEIALNPKKIKKTTEQLCEDFLYLFFNTVLGSEKIDGRALRKLVCTYPVDTPRRYREALMELVAKALTRLGLAAYSSDVPGSSIEEPKGTAIGAALDEATSGGWWWWYNVRMKELAANASETVLVYDYGGGTTDLSLLRFARTKRGYEVRILGVAGGKTCGGDDVTWRLAREFSFASELANCEWMDSQTKLGAKLWDVANQKKQNRAIWRHEFPYLTFMIDKQKLNALGTKVDEKWEELNEIFAPASTAAAAPAAKWIGIDALHAKRDDPTTPGHAEAKRFADHKPAGAQEANGRFCAVHFNERDFTFDAQDFYGEDSRELEPDKKRKAVNGYFAFDLLSESGRESVMHDALLSLETATRLVSRVLGEKARVDYLLVIGQASRTRIFQHELKTRLSALAHNEPIILERAVNMGGNEIDPKTCVACGACASEILQKQIIRVRTILRPIVCHCDEFGQAPNTVLMTSDSERNRIFEARPAKDAESPGLNDAPQGVFELLSNYTPEARDLYLDAGYDFNAGGGGKSTFQRVRKNRENWSELEGGFKLAVVDPDCDSYRKGDGFPPEILAIVAEANRKDLLKRHAQLLVIWPIQKPDDIAAFAFVI